MGSLMPSPDAGFNLILLRFYRFQPSIRLAPSNSKPHMKKKYGDLVNLLLISRFRPRPALQLPGTKVASQNF